MWPVESQFPILDPEQWKQRVLTTGPLGNSQYSVFFKSTKWVNEWVKSLSHVWLFATPWTVAHQAPPSMGFSRQEYWSGLPFSSIGDLPNPESKHISWTGKQILYHWAYNLGKNYLKIIFSNIHAKSGGKHTWVSWWIADLVFLKNRSNYIICFKISFKLITYSEHFSISFFFL